MEKYDYLVVNDKLEDCVEEMHGIIQSEHFKASRNNEFINTIKKELTRFAR